MTSIDLPANDNIANRKFLGERVIAPLGVDLCSWISSAGFAVGTILAGPSNLFENMVQTTVMLVCYALFLVSVLSIQRYMGTKTPALGTPTRLITSGFIQVPRNPTHLVFLLPLASIALLSVTAAVIALSLYVCAMNFTGNSGQDFTTYVKATRRWI